jgi:hypothetical protein
MAYDYAREKLWQAVDGLVGDGSIQDRLASAAMILTRLHRPDEDIPKELREEFKAVMHALTKETAQGNEGNIVATTRKLSSEEGAKLAHRIFSLYVQLRGGI